VSEGFGIDARGSIYLFRNADTGEKYLFALADVGFGASYGISISSLVKTVLANMFSSSKDLDNPDSYSKIVGNRPFSADDLNFAQGAEAVAGAELGVAGVSITLLSAWPFFSEGAPQPGEEVNNDYFSGAEIDGSSGIGASVSAAYQFLGKWFRLWSF
jgi:hypothetical protein